MNETPLEYFAGPGKSIDDACRESLRIANTNRLPVWFKFNGTRVDVTPGMRATDAVDQYFSKHNKPHHQTMNETEKRKAAIAAMNAYISYAKKNAQEIANESAAMHVRYMASDETYEYTAEYLRRRNEADRLRKEVQP